jgi:hypothetical protein
MPKGSWVASELDAERVIAAVRCFPLCNAARLILTRRQVMQDDSRAELILLNVPFCLPLDARVRLFLQEVQRDRQAYASPHLPELTASWSAAV